MMPVKNLISAFIFCWAIVASAALAQTSPRPTPTIKTNQILVLLRIPPPHVRSNGDYGGGYGDDFARAARVNIASRLARSYGLQVQDSWPMPLLGMDCFVMAVPTGQSPDEVAARLSHEPEVSDAQTSHMFKAQASASVSAHDPMLPAQPSANGWKLGDLHEIATGRGIRVAVVDSMVEKTHPDLVGQLDAVENFVANVPSAPESHGTEVAGIIAARANNGLGIVGIAPQARVLALRACWQVKNEETIPSGTICDSLSLAKALHYAIDNKAQVINLSLSGPPDILLSRLIDVAVAKGIRIVAAYDDKLPQGGFPASHAGVIAVSDNALATLPSGVYSAPGKDIPTTEPGGRWFVVNGSSFSAAHVSGLLALISERHPEQNVLPLVTAKTDGEIDACASLLRSSRRPDWACARSAGSSKAPQ